MFRLLAGLQLSTDRPLSTSGYLDGYRAAAAEIATTAGRFRAETSVTELLAVVDAEALAAWLHIDGFVCSDVVRPIQDSIRVDDYMATRVVELVVHTDDLAASLPDLPPPGLDPAAVAIAVRILLDLIAERAPGGSVELRVPPQAAVRCIESSQQTGGIPPSIVQMDQLTWLRLASGRVTWAAALDLVQAIGEPADLTPHLPLI